MNEKIKTLGQILVVALLVIFVGLHIKPSIAPYFTNRGIAYTQQGDLDNALATLKIASLLDPKNAQIRFHLGKVYKNKWQLSSAIIELQKAIALNPQYAKAYQLLANVYLQQKNFKEAVMMLTKSLESNPGNKESEDLLELTKHNYIKDQVDKAAESYAQEHFEDAKEFLQNASTLKPSFLYNLYVVKTIPEIDARKDELAVTLKKIIRLNPEDITAFRLIADLYLENGDYKKAIDYYNRYLAIEKNQLAIHNNIAICFNRLGRLDEAIDEYRIALSLEPDNVEVIYGLAATYKDKLMFEEAINLYNHLIKLETGFAYIYTDLGNIYGDLGDTNQARAHFDKAIEICNQNLINDTSDILSRLTLAEATRLSALYPPHEEAQQQEGVKQKDAQQEGMQEPEALLENILEAEGPQEEPQEEPKN
ncbi:tetratricopeptide repeat protein [Candidatus Omnitrophota bacterium]